MYYTIFLHKSQYRFLFFLPKNQFFFIKITSNIVQIHQTDANTIEKSHHFLKSKIFYFALRIYTCLLQNNMIK